MTMRIGFGYDVHAFAPNRPLVLGGVTIPHERGLSGHSDADTVIHAIVDALLGAAALGDIGQHFPSNDERWKSRPSAVFLDYTYNLLWAEHLRLDLEQVSVKATTTDGLGFAGRQEGIACYAVALIEK